MAKNGIEWTEALEKELYTPVEIEENNLQAKLICALIDARQAEGISQRDLEELSGITQSAIARLEKRQIKPYPGYTFQSACPSWKDAGDRAS